MGELGLGYYRDHSEAGTAAWAQAQAQAEEIDLDDDEGDDVAVEQKSVPAAVFGAAGVGTTADGGGGGMGALERFKRAQG